MTGPLLKLNLSGGVFDGVGELARVVSFEKNRSHEKDDTSGQT